MIIADNIHRQYSLCFVSLFLTWLSSVSSIRKLGLSSGSILYYSLEWIKILKNTIPFDHIAFPGFQEIHNRHKDSLVTPNPIYQVSQWKSNMSQVDFKKPLTISFVTPYKDVWAKDPMGCV